jgi:hypothetical protein
MGHSFCIKWGSYCILFPSCGPFRPSNMCMSAELEAICEEEVKSLHRKKAVEIFPQSELGFVSCLFPFS